MDTKVLNDYEGKKEEAKEWAEERYKDWYERELTHVEKNAVKEYLDYTEQTKDINKQLEETRGNIEKSEYRELIEKIDSSLKKEHTDQTMYVYRRINEQIFGFDEGSFRLETGGLDNEKLAKFEELFLKIPSIIKENGYIETSLSGESPNLNEEPVIYMKLKIPKGTHAAYIGNLSESEGTHDFLIDRGYGIQIKDASIVVQKAKNYVKVEADLVTREELEQEIREYNKTLNKNLGLGSNALCLELTERFITINYRNAEKIVETIKNINIDFLEEASAMLSDAYSNETLINLVDDKITKNESFNHLEGKDSNQLDENGTPIKYDNLNGLHLYLLDHATIVNISKSPEPVLDTLHELGHALDDLAFFTISEKSNFTEIHIKEQPYFLPNPYFSNRKEYFAEAFAYFHSSDKDLNNKLKTQAPLTHEFIKNLEL